MAAMANNKFIRNIAIKADDQGNLPGSIQLLHTGSWTTPWHGDFEITEGDIEQFAENFANGVGLPEDNDGKAAINYSHYGGEKAAGWLTNVRAERVDGVLSLVADPEWTPAGKTALVEGEFRYISPEFNPRALPWEDPEEEWSMVANVLTGAGLTNRPLFKKLKKVAASEIQGSSNKRTEGEPMSLKLEDVRTMEASALKDEHRAFLEEHKDQLSADELTKFGIKTETKVEANDKQVHISADELATLRANAQRGVEAAEKLAQTEASTFADARIEAGQVKSDQKADLVKILLASGESRTALESFLNGLPVNKDINADEIGKGGAPEGTATEQLMTRAEKIVADSQGKTRLNEAMKTVLASDKALSKAVDEERK